MTKLELSDVLKKIMTDNQFSMIERCECHSKFESEINSMQDIFDLNNSSDFTYLYAVSDLLSDVSDDVKSFLREENSDSAFLNDISLPDRASKLIVATAFEENVEFFSMAWNWVSIVEAEIKKNKCIHIFNVDLEIPVYAAASAGFNNVTRITADPIGFLEVQVREETGHLRFVVFLNPDMKKIKFEIAINFEINKEKMQSIIKKDWNEEDNSVSSDPIKVNFSKGLKILSISWKQL